MFMSMYHVLLFKYNIRIIIMNRQIFTTTPSKDYPCRLHCFIDLQRLTANSDLLCLTGFIYTLFTD